MALVPLINCQRRDYTAEPKKIQTLKFFYKFFTRFGGALKQCKPDVVEMPKTLIFQGIQGKKDH